MVSARRMWVHRAASFALLAVGTAAVLAVLLWLQSVKAWWSAALSSYVMGLLLVGGGVGAYAGWAFDDVDDPKEERRLGVIVLLLWVLLPLVFVLGWQALLVRFDLAPGSWPAVTAPL